MLTSFIRTFILLIIIVIAVRVMGKRQIGQLQPIELVVTILLSEIAATPMQDNDIPMLNTVIAILVLVSLEIFMSAAGMKSVKLRSLLQGNSLILIRNGEIDQKQMKRLRFTVDDLLEALRQKDVFDIKDVQYAIAETDGSLSVLLKPEKQTVTAEELNIEKKDTGLSCVIISDGEIVKTDFGVCGMNDKKLSDILASHKVRPEEIYLLTADRCGGINLIKKDG